MKLTPIGLLSLLVTLLLGCRFGNITPFADTPTYPPPSPSLAIADRIAQTASECGLSPYEPFPTIEATPDDTLNALFTRQDDGWTGGGSLHSVPTADGRTLWLSTNPLFGGRNADGSRAPAATTYAHNALLIQTGEQLATPPPQDTLPGPAPDTWYSLGAGLTTDQGIIVVAGQIQKTGPGLFDVARQNTTLITLAPSDFSVQAVTPITPTPAISTTYGDALLTEDEWVYIYGTHSLGGFIYQTYLARAPRTDLTAWEYRTAEGWSADSAAAVPIFQGRIAGMVKQANRYYLLTPSGTALLAYQSCTPFGPWQNAIPLYTIPDRFPADGKNALSITSAAVHPTATPDEWLLSYHVNFFFGAPEEVNSTADVGRPRFVRLRLSPPPLEEPPPITGDLQPLDPAPDCTLYPADTVITAAIDEPLTTLFDRNDAGWTAADGGYTVPLPDGRIAWLFGDTFLGGVQPDGTTVNPFFSVRNALTVQTTAPTPTLETRVGSLEDPRDTVPPPDGLPSNVAWYWPGAGTVAGNQVQVVMGRIRQSGEGSWGFSGIGTDVATFSLPDLELQSTTPVAQGTVVQYGAALLTDGDYTYIYGREERPEQSPLLHVARVDGSDLTGTWSYFTGEDWSTDPLASRPIFAGISSSVVRQGDAYWLIDQPWPFGSTIRAHQACTPWGPWSTPLTLYTAPESEQNLFTYFAILHPELSATNRLLLTYSVNGEGITNTVTNYRPRFIRLTVASDR